jgi:hypothetical protein
LAKGSKRLIEGRHPVSLASGSGRDCLVQCCGGIRVERR